MSSFPNAAPSARNAPRARTRRRDAAGGLALDNTPVVLDNEILCDVETLNIDSASFKQITDACERDAERIAEHILDIVNERGKQHNPVTGSGGMFIGRVAEIGEALAERSISNPATASPRWFRFR